MKLIGLGECYSKMPEAQYGQDAYGNKIDAPEGYNILTPLTYLQEGDCPFDVYAGWLETGYWHPDYHFQAVSISRWTTWARKNDKT